MVGDKNVKGSCTDRRWDQVVPIELNYTCMQSSCRRKFSDPLYDYY